jgi:Zn-dependent M28 family amino/carboxypeptidase
MTGEEKALSAELRDDVTMMSGLRNLTQAKDALDRTRTELEAALRATGLIPRQDDTGNLDVEIGGTSKPKEIVVVGGHYDSALNAAGADDNATGAAGVLALARRFAKKPGARTLRLAVFSNEEMPYFGTAQQGSLAYARACKARGDEVVAMISLETMGYFDDAPSTQHYPWGFGALYPDRGNFIGFVGDLSSRSLLRDSIRTFRETTSFPSEGAALPRFVPGVGWSDHWSFWQVGYPAIMVTDTAPFRNPHYHTMSDRPETLDFDRFARVMAGIERVVERLLNSPT